MGQGGQLFRHDPPVIGHVAGANLHEVIEAAGDHVALFDLGDRAHRGVERLQCGLARIAQFQLDIGDMGQPQLDRRDHRAVALDEPGFLHLADARGHRRLRQADPARYLSHGEACIGDKLVEDSPVDRIDLFTHGLCSPQK